MSKQTRKTRGGGGNKDLPPIDEALRSEESYGTYSSGYRALDRDRNTLPNPSRYNYPGQKSNFQDTLGSYAGVDTLEPSATSKYSSTTAGFDKYANDRKASGGTPDYGYAGSAQGARDFNVGYQRRQRPHGSSSRDDSGTKHSSSSQRQSSSKHQSSSSRSGQHYSSSSCKDPKGKGKKDDYNSDDEYDDAAPRGYGGTSSGSYYGSSSASTYYGRAY
ncbi:hypothetical protein PG991_016297 [Apiospora marii]|uniref:Uncharacterized protein n=1 Tax=Apiospora marii TaxID=335849 RepID=A0ABR1QZP9_9PEZI